MKNWSSSLIETVCRRLRDDEYWRFRLTTAQGQQTPRTFHLAVFVEPILQFVLEGKKTVESRFSINRCAPYSVVEPGDVILIKGSGGPVKAVAEVTNVWSYELAGSELETIKKRFGTHLWVNDTFWASKANCCYATLMKLSKLRKFDPVPCAKRDRRGWVVLNEQQPRLAGL
jgi:ASC-1-like (ASCH) protein